MRLSVLRPFSSNSASSLKKLGTWKTTPEPIRLTQLGLTRPDGRRWKLTGQCRGGGAGWVGSRAYL